jgi:hypothetical protein
MAKKKAPAKGKAGPETKTIGFRVTAEYAGFLERVASADRSTIAGMIDRAVARYAREIGVEEPPPERTS